MGYAELSIAVLLFIELIENCSIFINRISKYDQFCNFSNCGVLENFRNRNLYEIKPKFS